MRCRLTPTQLERCVQDLMSSRPEAANVFYSSVAPYIKAQVALRAPDLVRLVLEDDVVQTVAEMLVGRERPYRPISKSGQPNGYLRVLILKSIDRVRAASGQRGGTIKLTGPQVGLERRIATATPMISRRRGQPPSVTTPVVTAVTHARHEAAMPLDMIELHASTENIEAKVVSFEAARDWLRRLHEASPRLAHVAVLRAAGVPARQAEGIAGIATQTCARHRARFLAQEDIAA